MKPPLNPSACGISISSIPSSSSMLGFISSGKVEASISLLPLCPEYAIFNEAVALRVGVIGRVLFG
ncbi:MAG: hypothetical protein ACLR56_08005 [Oscillospiraceae bacterium]